MCGSSPVPANSPSRGIQHSAFAMPGPRHLATPTQGGIIVGDPVTDSLNTSLAQWLLGNGQATAPYIACQGTALGRAGRIQIEQDADGTIWVNGGTVTCVSGRVEL